MGPMYVINYTFLKICWCDSDSKDHANSIQSDDADMAILDNMEKSECSRQNAMVGEFEVDMVADMIADMVADLEVDKV